MIKKEEVQHIAKLARLGLTKDEIKKFQKDLSSILDYFNSIKEVDISKTEPTFHPTEHSFGRVQERKLETMREDMAESQPVETTNKLIEAAPKTKDRYLKVKSILS